MKRIFWLHNLQQSLAGVSITATQARYYRKICSDTQFALISKIEFVPRKYESQQHGIELDIDWNSEMQEVYEEETNHSLLKIIRHENLINSEPKVAMTFNLAAYASKSSTLLELLKHGVDLYKIERKKGLAKYLINLELERHLVKHIYFLSEKIGIDAALLGPFLTKNPLIFRVNLEDLQNRVSYLESKNFNLAEIKNVVNKNPFWLMYSTRRIDTRLGFFQREFGLTGNEVRKLAVLSPRLITYSLDSIKELTFSLREELGLSTEDTKNLLLKFPKIWFTCNLNFLYTF